MMWWIAIAVVVVVVVMREVYVATHIQTCAYLPAICQTNGNGVMLTFDDGPDEINTPKVLCVLKKYNVKAAFFCIGSKAEKSPEVLQSIVSDGHVIGQHTYHHNPFRSFCSSSNYRHELMRAHEVFARLGVHIKLFRPPLGITNIMIKQAVKSLGYTTVAWSVRSFDTRSEGRDKVLRRVRQQLKPDSIILLHDRLEHCDELTEAIIAEVIERGWTFCNPNTFFEQ